MLRRVPMKLRMREIPLSLRTLVSIAGTTSTWSGGIISANLGVISQSWMTSLANPSSSQLNRTASATAFEQHFRKPQHHHYRMRQQQRSFSFSFAGPRKLDELLKKDLLDGKSSTEIADLWYTYHEEKENVLGLILTAESGLGIMRQAKLSPFFVQPVFREDGYFMLVSQFQSPSHFLVAYLEDYKMDPQSATPLLTFSIFDDYTQDPQNICLVRCDITNRAIRDDEGQKVVSGILHNYEMEYQDVQTFNERPKHFDFEHFLDRMKKKWNSGTDDAEIDSTVVVELTDETKK